MPPMATASPAWDARVTELLQLYIAVTDPRLKTWAHELATFQEKAQAITQLARVNGHSWIPFTGEDLASMARTGLDPTEFFHPLCLMAHKRYKFWSTTVNRSARVTPRPRPGPAPGSEWCELHRRY